MGYINEEIYKVNLQDNSLYSIPTKEDLIQCKQLIMFYICRAKIYNDQMFYNDLCYQYFGEGYNTNFKVDDIKASYRVLSYQAFHKREKWYNIRWWIYTIMHKLFIIVSHFFAKQNFMKKIIYSMIGFFSNLHKFQSIKTQISIQMTTTHICHKFFLIHWNLMNMIISKKNLSEKWT